MKKINNTFFNYEVFKWRSKQDQNDYLDYDQYTNDIFTSLTKNMVKKIFSQSHKKMWFDDDMFLNFIKMLDSDDTDTSDLLREILYNSSYKFSPKQNSLIFSKDEYIRKLYDILTPLQIL